MPSVFIINEPLRRDNASGELVRWLPMGTTANFGNVVRLTPDGSPPANIDGYVITMLETGLADWSEEDFIVLVGDQTLLALASAIVGRKAPKKIKFLKWDRRLESYTPSVVKMGPTP